MFPSLPTIYFPLFITVTGACHLGDVGAHGWVVRFCQSSVQSPSWSWLLIVEAHDVSDTQPPLGDAAVKCQFLQNFKVKTRFVLFSAFQIPCLSMTFPMTFSSFP